MSYVDRLIDAYGQHIAIPWQQDLAHPQRVLMAIYPPDQEQRLRLRVKDFETATAAAGHGWRQLDITNAFEEWLGEQEYREAYFKKPHRLDVAMDGFFETLSARVTKGLNEGGQNDVVAVIGAGSLFGLGEKIRVSGLLNEVDSEIRGRLLVFFPGTRDDSRYRLLGAGDGWNYLATPIVATGG